MMNGTNLVNNSIKNEAEKYKEIVEQPIFKT